MFERLGDGLVMAAAEANPSARCTFEFAFAGGDDIGGVDEKGSAGGLGEGDERHDTIPWILPRGKVEVFQADDWGTRHQGRSELRDQYRNSVCTGKYRAQLAMASIRVSCWTPLGEATFPRLDDGFEVWQDCDFVKSGVIGEVVLCSKIVSISCFFWSFVPSKAEMCSINLDFGSPFLCLLFEVNSLVPAYIIGTDCTSHVMLGLIAGEEIIFLVVEAEVVKMIDLKNTEFFDTENKAMHQN